MSHQTQAVEIPELELSPEMRAMAEKAAGFFKNITAEKRERVILLSGGYVTKQVSFMQFRLGIQQTVNCPNGMLDDYWVALSLLQFADQVDDLKRSGHDFSQYADW